MNAPCEHGQVTSFDTNSGTGVISTAHRSVAFHCVEISDGTRTIDVGAAVSFRLQPGLRGWEAVSVTSGTAAIDASTFACPVCSMPVIGAARSYEICPQCGWEDDPVQLDDPDYGGGANHQSLNASRVDWSARQR